MTLIRVYNLISRLNISRDFVSPTRDRTRATHQFKPNVIVRSNVYAFVLVTS